MNVRKMDEPVSLCVAAEKFNLQCCQEQCKLFISTTVLNPKPLKRPILTLDHVQKIQPMLIKYGSETVQMELNLTKEELESTLFPKLFVQSQFMNCTVSVSFLIDSGYWVHGHDVDGDYVGVPAKFEYRYRNLLIRRDTGSGGDWVLERECNQVSQILCKSLHSSVLPIPPSDGWVQVSDDGVAGRRISLYVTTRRLECA